MCELSYWGSEWVPAQRGH